MPIRTAVLLLAVALAWTAEVLPDGWRVEGGGSAAIAANEIAPGGGAVVQLRAAATGTLTVTAAQSVVATPGAPLVADLLVRAEQPGRMLTVFFYAAPTAEGHWYQTRLVPLTTSWVPQRLEVAAPSGPAWAGRPIFLRLRIDAGEAQVAGVRFSQGAVATTVASDGNLLVNPGFDVGGGGWFLQSWAPYRPGVPARTAESPHSPPFAMRLPPGGASIISRTVPFTPGRPYILSLHMRLTPGAPPASGRAARFFLLTPNWRIAQGVVQVAELGAEWRRFSVACRHDDLGGEHANLLYARIDPEAAIDVDSVQLQVGERAGDYAPGVQLGLEPPGVRGTLPPGAGAVNAVLGLPGGNPRPLQLELRGTAGDGRELYRRRIDVPAGADTRRVVPVPLEHAAEGVVSCALTVRDGDAVLAAGEARYLVAGAPPALNPLVGVDTLPNGNSLDTLALAEAQARLLGLGYRRSFYHLQAGEPEAGLAHAVQAYAIQRQAALRTQIVIEPEEASCFNFGRMQQAGVPPDDAAFAADIPRYVARFTEVCRALTGLVDEVELLNEPNIWGVKGREGMPPARYVQLLRAVRPAMQAAAPGMRLAIQVNGVDTDWIGRVAALGGLGLADLVTVHAYRANPEHPVLVDDLARLRTLLDRFVPGMPIANSEQYYGLLGHGIVQGEHDRHYCGDDEEDITGRLLQTVLHGLSAGAPFALLTPGSGLWCETPFDAPWLYHAAGGLRAIARLGAGVGGGRDLPVHESVRALLLRRADGSHLVSLNARLTGEHGTIEPPTGCTAYDSDGNALPRGTLRIGCLPLYLAFPPSVGEAAVAAAVQGALFTGFAFPVVLEARRDAPDRVTVLARNRERLPVRAQVRWPGEVQRPAWDLDLAPAGSASTTLTVDNLRWQDDAVIGYEISAGPAMDAGQLRIPVLAIPRLPAATLAAWTPERWLELGDERLSLDFAPERPHRGAADLAAGVAVAWSQTGLHLIVQTTDDAVVTGPNAGGNAWARDSLQLYIDQRAAARTPRALTDSASTAWIVGCSDAGAGFAWLDLAPAGRFIGGANATHGLDPAPTVDWRRSATGWECRASFPPAALPQLALEAGSVLGLSLLINDDDGAGRKQGLTLGPAGSEPIGRPWLWKRCQLAP